MFMLSFVLEDWALHELLPQPKERRVAITLVASSYVTWTFQTHTFSNSIETLIVLWSLVLIGRIRDDKERTQVTACIALAFLGVLGVFNRITFPAFMAVPAVQLVPALMQKPMRILVLAVAGLLVMAYAVLVDTDFYDVDVPRQVRQFGGYAVLTPWNNLKYNLSSTNLATHGIHPFWQHYLVNLPTLLGPAGLLLTLSSRKSLLFGTAIVSVLMLSVFKHQEPRFLLPAVPLLLASVKLPLDLHLKRAWVAIWVIFNVCAGVLFGIYHQGGVVPAQQWIAQQEGIQQVTWWKTYSPPQWLLDGRNDNVKTIDLMGMEGPEMIAKVFDSASCGGEHNLTVLVAPASAKFLDSYTDWQMQELWRYNKHIGLDDLDFSEGVRPELQRVIGRRGLVVWNVKKYCDD